LGNIKIRPLLPQKRILTALQIHTFILLKLEIPTLKVVEYVNFKYMRPHKAGGRTTVLFYKHATPSGSVDQNQINICGYTVGQ
jgi:hypothetical protein